MTLVQTTYVLAMFVRISNISADPILSKLFGPIFGGLNIFGPTFFWRKLVLTLNFGAKNSLYTNFLLFDSNSFGQKIFFTNNIYHILLQFFWPIVFVPKFDKTFFVPKKLLQQKQITYKNNSEKNNKKQYKQDLVFCVKLQLK